MRTSTILSLGALTVAQAAFQPAAVIKNNVAGKSYVAKLSPAAGAKFAISGSVLGVASSSGQGVDWSVSVSGFDPSLGPFAYHIHDQPVDASGNCSSTKAHLDPTLRGEDPPCDKSTPALCQVGDLAGKQGKITGSSLAAHYHDDFTSTSPGDHAFFGNRSVTFHLPDKTRIACANFELVPAAGSASTGVIPYPPGGGAPYPTGTGVGAPYPSGSGVGSGYPMPSGTGAGPYPTAGAPPTTPSSSGAGQVPNGPTASPSALPTGAASTVKAGVTAVVVVAGLVALLM